MYPEAYSGLDQYRELLATDGLTRGLIGPNEVPRLWERHILNCALISDAISKSARVVDIGAGAGLPGLVLAIVRPDLDVTLVDTQARRVKFLDEAIERLALGSRCRAVQGRVPAYWQGALSQPPAAVVARGLAPLGELIEWSWPAVQKGAVLLAIKGRGAQQEIEEFRGSGSTLVPMCHVELVEYGGAKFEPATTVIRVLHR